MIIQTDNKNFKEVIEVLEREGYTINSTSNDDTEICMQKNDIQIDVTDLKNYKK